MKKIAIVPVNFLRIYPEERSVESAVNKVKGTRAGALVFREMLPKSEGQSDNNAIELSGKQITNLASMHGNAIRGKGRDGWLDLATYVGVCKSVATISYEEHVKGDKYVDSEGNEQVYTKTTMHCNVDSIVLPDKVTDVILTKTIEKNINWKDQASLIDQILNPTNTDPLIVKEPAVDGLK